MTIEQLTDECQGSAVTDALQKYNSPAKPTKLKKKANKATFCPSENKRFICRSLKLPLRSSPLTARLTIGRAPGPMQPYCVWISIPSRYRSSLPFQVIDAPRLSLPATRSAFAKIPR